MTDSSPTLVKPIDRPEPIVRACALTAVTFARRDVARMLDFLGDFGFVDTGLEKDGRRFVRSRGDMPYSVEIIPSDQDRLVGFSLAVACAEDLQALSRHAHLPIEAADGPGGGMRVRLTDPDGWRIDAVQGFKLVEPLEIEDRPIPTNAPGRKTRVNAAVRRPVAPSPVIRMGHVVLQVADFAASMRWYIQHFGFIPSDVQVLDDGTAALGFFRMDRGDEPTDHHTLAILAGPAPALLHVSTETVDLDAIGYGQQHLRERGWAHYWGIGRHILGSQIFDYWKDSAGDEWEHYADGDLLTRDFPTGYHKLSRGSLWAWGDDLPESMRPPDPLPNNLPPHVELLLRALSVAPRSWLR